MSGFMFDVRCFGTKPIETEPAPSGLELEYLPTIASPAKEGWNFYGAWMLVLGAFSYPLEKFAHKRGHTHIYPYSQF